MMTQRNEEPGNPALLKLIQERIRSQGRITFAEFMDLALYSPGLGYYMSPGEKIGPQGDYYTSTEVHSLFGEMVGRQLVQIADTFKGLPLMILEMGAGKGLLCMDILNDVRKRSPDVYHRLTYFIVEKSPVMVQQQKQRLASHLRLREDKVRWVEGLDDPMLAEGIAGFVISNELVDAFPVHRVVRQGGRLWEVYVTLKEGRLTEVLGAPSTPLLTQYFERLGIDLKDGQQAEVNLKALDWIRQVGRALNKGVVITIDYGYPAAELYSRDRPRGTFLCYYKHRVSENPYIRVGWQDMTAHVDFTSLALAGREAGLQFLGYTTQEYFLISLGIAQEMETRLASYPEGQVRERELAALKHLISPSGLGRVFKILIQGKGLEDLRLEGLNYRPFAAETLFSL